MKPFRKYLAIAVDGGGVRGGMVVRALHRLEEHLGSELPELANLFVGTSAGSIISAALACGSSATRLDGTFAEFATAIFQQSWRNWPLVKYLVRYQYPNLLLESYLKDVVGELTFEEFNQRWPQRKLVTTTFDVLENRTRFLKTDKTDYKDWTVSRAVMASTAAPTYFPVIEGRYVDGGVGSYNNPCYLAAYEIYYVLKLDPRDVTLLSIGTGRGPARVKPGEAEKFNAIGWLEPILDGFSYSADDQQVGLVDTFFPELDFRRFQVDMKETIALDDASKMPEILDYGEQLAEMILNDKLDRAMGVRPGRSTPQPENP